MGLTKTQIFSKNQNYVAMVSKVLGHPARIAILEHLSTKKTCVCGELVLEIGLSQPTISQHLKELKNIGIIKGTIEGTRICYCIDPKKWEEFRHLLTNFFNKINTSTNVCC
ncbi:MAG: ArsR/SmtB family transcription factor [Flavicella sp.]